jgi:hypothetical protein
MATKQANGSAVTKTSTKNNLGVVKHGGTIASTKWDSEPVPTKSFYNGNRATAVKDGIAKANASGTLNQVAKGKYIAPYLTTSLAGVTQNLASPAADYSRDSIHKSEKSRKTFLTGLSIVSDPGAKATVTYTRSTSNITFGNDDAARPTRSAPGGFVIKEPKAIPVRKDYAKKTN